MPLLCSHDHFWLGTLARFIGLVHPLKACLNYGKPFDSLVVVIAYVIGL